MIQVRHPHHLELNEHDHPLQRKGQVTTVAIFVNSCTFRRSFNFSVGFRGGGVGSGVVGGSLHGTPPPLNRGEQNSTQQQQRQQQDQPEKVPLMPAETATANSTTTADHVQQYLHTCDNNKNSSHSVQVRKGNFESRPSFPSTKTNY